MKVRRSKKVMENYVCPSCWNQIQSCTCKFYPPHSLIMIDVNIQEIIRILNQKGYQTIGCCESHFDDGGCSVYVAFPYDMEFIIPEGFSYSKNKPSISYIYKKNERENKELFDKVKEEKLRVLLEWAQALPEYKYKFNR